MPWGGHVMASSNGLVPLIVVIFLGVAIVSANYRPPPTQEAAAAEQLRLSEARFPVRDLSRPYLLWRNGMAYMLCWDGSEPITPPHQPADLPKGSYCPSTH